jgi:hypothetical protein
VDEHFHDGIILAGVAVFIAALAAFEIGRFAGSAGGADVTGAIPFRGNEHGPATAMRAIVILSEDRFGLREAFGHDLTSP